MTVEIPPEVPPSEDAPTPYRYTNPLDQWRQLPEWKRVWFERLSQRDLEMIFPSDQANLDEWMLDRAHTRGARKFYAKVGQLGLTAIVSVLAMGLMSLLWLGFLSKVK